MNRKEFFAGLAGLIALPVLGKKVEGANIPKFNSSSLIGSGDINLSTKEFLDKGQIGERGPVGEKGLVYCSDRLLTQLKKEDNILLMGLDKNAPHEGYLDYPTLFNDIIVR